MDIQEIETKLTSSDFSERLKAIAQLKDYDSEVAVPLLLSRIKDRQFLVRSFVAMGLGKKQTAESFAALLELIKFDRDPNVRAEAANSLSLFGQVAASHLTTLFHQDDNWLVRRSVLAALVELNCPEELFDVCSCGIQGEDVTVQEASIDGFGYLANSDKNKAALDKLLSLLKAEWWRVRVRVARALGKFEVQEAKDALVQLRQDEDYRVVGAALKALV